MSVPETEPRPAAEYECPTVRAVNTGFSLLHAIETRGPESYFSRENRANWTIKPDVVGFRPFTFFWASALANSTLANPDQGITLHKFANTWPLPVGTASLHDRIDRIEANGTKGYYGDLHFLCDFMPFDDDERAAFILQAKINGCRVEAFGLAVEVPEAEYDDEGEAYDEFYRVGEMKTRIVGTHPTSAAVTEFCREAGNWWHSLAGKPFAPGRPPKTLPYETAQRQYWTVKDHLEEAGERRKPSGAEVRDSLEAAGLSIGKTKFNDLVQEWRRGGLSWPPARPESSL